MVWPSMNKGMGMFGTLIFFLWISFCAIIFSIFCIHEPNKEDQGQKDETEAEKNEKNSEEEDEPEALWLLPSRSYIIQLELG